MAKNYVGDDDVVQITSPSGGTTSGTPLVVGALFGVPLTTTAAGDPVAVAVEGVWELPKLSTAVLSAGAKVSWDATHGYINTPGTGLYPVGIATVAAGNGVTTVKVRLDGIATAAA